MASIRTFIELAIIIVLIYIEGATCECTPSRFDMMSPAGIPLCRECECPDGPEGEEACDWVKPILGPCDRVCEPHQHNEETPEGELHCLSCECPDGPKGPKVCNYLEPRRLCEEGPKIDRSEL